MPSTIVPEAQEIRAEATRLFMQPQPTMQAIYRLPKHYPTKQIEALLVKVMEFAREAEIIARQWEAHLEAERKHWETVCAEWDAKMEAEEDAQLFLETCAAEHLFFPDVLAG